MGGVEGGVAQGIVDGKDLEVDGEGEEEDRTGEEEVVEEDREGGGEGDDVFGA